MPPRSRKPKGPTPVDAIAHDEKRTNLPTADAQDFVTPETEAGRTIMVSRDQDVPEEVNDRDRAADPQLVWKGKYPDDDPAKAGDLEADAPPIYIQEHIVPHALVENLRQTAKAGELEPELSLFEPFEQLGDLERVEFYQHPIDWSNRMILGDSLQVMGSLAEREELRGQVQMIYIDPPYGIKFGSNWQASTRKRDVKDGKLEDAAREAEQIKAFRDTWKYGIHSYLSYLRDRLLVARELLTESGSCFVQIGDENAHLVRSLMDEVFGAENFVSQIVFRKTTGKGGQLLDNTYDLILWYGRNRDSLKYRYLYEARTVADDQNLRYVELANGERRAMSSAESAGSVALPGAARAYRPNPLTNQRPAQGADLREFDLDGRTYTPGSGTFRTDYAGLRKLEVAERLLPMGRTLTFVRYLDDFPFKPRSDIWDDTRQSGFGDAKVYVVQTGTKVIERCILMCTDPGDMVLDPTCGSGTSAYVAEQWGRRWITIDTSRVALALARQRLMGARFPYYLLADSEAGRRQEQKVTQKLIPHTPTRGDIRHGFVYERVQHITLKSIANNPDIRDGMPRKEIDEAIKKHADFEPLYDRPYEDKSAVRVTGRFTVESLSPHRSLAFAGPDVTDRESISERLGIEQPTGDGFEQSILDNLAKAGIQNGHKGERIELESLDPYAGTYIQAIGVQRSDGPDPIRVGVAVGPQYGTVSATFIKEAAREANRSGEIDIMCVLAFAFDAQASAGLTEEDGVTIDFGSSEFAHVERERAMGKVKLLQVRMNVDLLMGDALKKTGAGNLFTVFGEPDIGIATDDAGDVIVELRGVDIYDPTAGQVRSDGTDKIALWMIDTDYNGDAFFVRHCYFTGGNDPYKRLKTSLKADIDADAWESLYQTTSRPFAKPQSGRIAVKVINDYGDEVMKVFEVGS